MRILRWLTYVPRHKGAGVLTNALTPGYDPIDRPVTYAPVQNEGYDPRWLICGRGEGEKGLFDTGSFDEMMPSWAKTVVAGRYGHEHNFLYWQPNFFLENLNWFLVRKSETV